MTDTNADIKCCVQRIFLGPCRAQICAVKSNDEHLCNYIKYSVYFNLCTTHYYIMPHAIGINNEMCITA